MQKGKKYPPEALTPDEAKRLIKACSHRAPTGIRNRALLTVGYRAGLRISEALGLYPKDIDTETGVVTVLHGKGDKSRTVGIDPMACAVVQNWIDRRKQHGLNARQRLFCTLKGEPIKPDYVRALMPRLARKAGIEKRVHYHALRHTFAYELSKERVPVAEIQRLLGHANLEITGRYLAHIAPHDLIRTMRMRQWTL